MLWTILYLAYRGWPLARAGAWRPLARAAGPLAAAAALALLLTAPLLGAMIRDLRDADYLVRDPAESLDFSADLAAYLANERHRWCGGNSTRSTTAWGPIPPSGS